MDYAAYRDWILSCFPYVFRAPLPYNQKYLKPLRQALTMQMPLKRHISELWSCHALEVAEYLLNREQESYNGSALSTNGSKHD